MSAIAISLKRGAVLYTKDYTTVEEVNAALERYEPLNVFWYTGWGKRYNETLLVSREEVCDLLTEREIP